MASKLTLRKQDALDVNIYDEVPDSGFFVNRHARHRLSSEELKEGSGSKAGAPDPQGPWKVVKGKTEGVSAGLFIEDSKGDQYLLKFDPKDHPELATAA